VENLPLTWNHVEACLREIPNFNPQAVAKFFREGKGLPGIHFFKVRYAPDEVIMPKGTYSDYAAIHLRGAVGVREVELPGEVSGPGCWDRPLARRLDNLVVNGTKDAAGPAAGERRFPFADLIAWVARKCPLLPLALVRLRPGWGPALARLLRGRLPAVPRAERELARPGRAPHAEAAPGQPPPLARITTRDEHGNPLPVVARFMGVTSAVWNQPRSATLVALNDGDEPCEMLLIKRLALREILEKCPSFYDQKMEDFIATTLPALLAQNRLFRDRVDADAVNAWPGLLACLRGDGGAADSAAGRPVREKLGEKARAGLAHLVPASLDDADRARLLSALNEVLQDRTLPDAAAWPEGPPGAEAGRLWRDRESLTPSEVYRLNRLLFETAFPGVIKSSPTPYPLSPADFRKLAHDLAAEHKSRFGKTLQPQRCAKGQTVYRTNDEADALYLILSGMVRVALPLPGGEAVVNNLDSGGYFGESCLPDPAAGAGPPRRSATVTALCSSNLLRIDRAVVEKLAQDYPSFGERLRQERRRMHARDEQRRAGRRLPPGEPPREIAARLLLTRNVLLIDMDLCTRCDQCVRGCAEAHDMQPRFHRANPDLRFGKWEVAGACLHCLDAPCQEACPVGAITFLENRAVQIHRTRCIGCTNCAHACPFGVIDMYERTSPEDAPSLKKGVERVATKCDLCLTDDRDPPCVASCPYDAARRVAPLEFFSGIRGWATFTDPE
jgi:Fe-S-cluster-containing hydrogenase component 2/CRP-like cAMP-binding protein